MLLEELQSVLDLIICCIDQEAAGCHEAALGGLQAAHTQLLYAKACIGSELGTTQNSLVDEVCEGILITFSAAKKQVRFIMPFNWHACMSSQKHTEQSFLLQILKNIMSDSTQAAQMEHESKTDLLPLDSKVPNNTSQQSERSTFLPPIDSTDLKHGLARKKANYPPGVPIQGALIQEQDAGMGSEEQDGNDAAGSSIAAANSVQILQQCQRQVSGSLDELSGLE